MLNTCKYQLLSERNNDQISQYRESDKRWAIGSTTSFRKQQRAIGYMEPLFKSKRMQELVLETNTKKCHAAVFLFGKEEPKHQLVFVKAKNV